MNSETVAAGEQRLAEIRKHILHNGLDNPVYLELRRIYCCKGAAFAGPTLEKGWLEIERLEAEKLYLSEQLSEARKALADLTRDYEALRLSGEKAFTEILGHKQALTEAAKLEREACAKRMCPMCRQGQSLEFDGDHGWLHRKAVNEPYVGCKASAIWRSL